MKSNSEPNPAGTVQGTDAEGPGRPDRRRGGDNLDRHADLLSAAVLVCRGVAGRSVHRVKTAQSANLSLNSPPLRRIHRLTCCNVPAIFSTALR